MDAVSSSSDNVAVHELASYLTWDISKLQHSLDSIKVDSRQIQSRVKFILEQAEAIHQQRDESRREELQGYMAAVDTLKEALGVLAQHLDRLSTSFKEETD